MVKLLPHIYSFLLPLFSANVVHMLIVKFKLFESTAKPISEELFGSGKTYRAFLVLPVLTGLFSILFHFSEVELSIHFLIGFLLGFVYLLAELPNSYIKRKMGIKSGELNQKRKILQIIIDKLDSILVLGIVYYFITVIEPEVLFALLVLSFIIHLGFSYLLFILRIKKTF